MEEVIDHQEEAGFVTKYLNRTFNWLTAPLIAFPRNLNMRVPPLKPKEQTRHSPADNSVQQAT